MKSEFKDFKIEIFKEKLKKDSVIYICNAKANKSFISDMQYYTNFDFDCHKVTNIVTRKCLLTSSYINYTALFSGLITLAEFKNSTDITKNYKELNKKHILLSININNKIYTSNEKMIKNLLLNFKSDSRGFLTYFSTNVKNFKKVSK